jgi:AcrR family transcriptional regulator
MLIRSGEGVTMPGIARQAGVSDATAYRHFADLLAVLREGFVGVWPDVSEALPDLIALTITHPDENVGTRPAYRLELIDKALEGAIGLSPVVTTDAPSA